MDAVDVKASEIIALENVEAMSVEDHADRATDLNLHLNAGNLVLIQLGAADLSKLLADICHGLAIVTGGKVKFGGRAWSDRSPRQAAAARERIGRIFRRELWINHLTIHQNVEFAQLHHSQRAIKQIRADTNSMGARAAQLATVMIFFRPVDVAAIARNQASGVRLSVTATRRNPPECIEARAKVTSKMNQILAELDAASNDALSLMLDIHGNVAENSVANFFIVRNGAVWTPPERNILEGVTRIAVIELCEKLNIPFEERNFTMYDVSQADECFLTSSAICAMPVREIDSFQPRLGVPGPITGRLIAAFADETGFDFAKLPKAA